MQIVRGGLIIEGGVMSSEYGNPLDAGSIYVCMCVPTSHCGKHIYIYIYPHKTNEHLAHEVAKPNKTAE